MVIQKQLSMVLFAAIWILVLLPSTLLAQQNIDSLISSWNKLAEDFLELNQIDSACKYGNCLVDMMEQELELNPKRFNSSELKNLKKQKAEALGSLVSAYGSSGQLDLARECYQSALKIYQEIDDQEGIYHVHLRMGRVNDMRSSYAEAIPYYNKALVQAEKLSDVKGMALVYYHLGLNNRYLGNYSEALKYHLEDLRIQE